MEVSLDQLAVNAELCKPGTQQCVKASTAKIHLDSLSKNGKRATGSFTVGLGSAGHWEGRFSVKDQRVRPTLICE
jgi:hypothetical protein